MLSGHIRYLNPESLIQSLQQLALDMGPAIELFLFHRRFLVLCDVASIKEVMLKRPKIFRRDKGIEVAFDVLGLTHHSLFSAEGSTWARLRKLLSSPFNKQNVSRMAAAVQAEVDAMLEGLRHAPGGISADVNVPMMQFTLRVILRVAFNNADIDDYFASNGLMVDTNTVFEFITQRTLYPFPSWTWHMWPPPIQQAVLLANDRIDAVVGRIVNNEKLKMDQAGNSLTEGRSFIQLLLLESVDGGKLSTEEVVANIKTMIFAGSETTSVTLSWALYFLSLDRQFLKKAREESDEVLANIAAHDGELPALPFCAACFKEVLRFRGPAALIGAGKEFVTSLIMFS